jgi:hypothetical protein
MPRMGEQFHEQLGPFLVFAINHADRVSGPP